MGEGVGEGERGERGVGLFHVSLAVAVDEKEGRSAIMTEKRWKKSNSILEFPPLPLSSSPSTIASPAPVRLGSYSDIQITDDILRSLNDDDVSEDFSYAFPHDESSESNEENVPDGLTTEQKRDAFRRTRTSEAIRNSVTNLLPSLLDIFNAVHEYEYESREEREGEVAGELLGSSEEEMSQNYFQYSFSEDGSEDPAAIWQTLPSANTSRATTPLSHTSETSNFVFRRLKVGFITLIILFYI